MKRTTLILAIILLVVILGGGAWWWMNRDTISFPWQSTVNTNPANGNRNTVVNTPNLNTVVTNTSTEVKGDTTATGTFTVSGVTVNISSLQTYSSYNRVTAEKGKKILVIYIDQVATLDVTKVSAGLLDQGKLVVGGADIAMGQYKVAGTQVGGDRGWLTFQVPEGTTSASLVIGAGATATTIPLTLKK